MVTTRKEREFGILEKYQLSKQLAKAYGNVCFAAELNHPERTKDVTQFYLSRLKLPLKKLIESHACLSLVIKDKENPTVHFDQLTSVDLTQLITVSSDNTDLDSLTQEQCAVEFDIDSQSPLWRLKFVPITSTSCIALLAFHHVIGDGSALSTFWTELLNELQLDNHDNEENFVIRVPEDLKLPLPYELVGPPELSVLSDVLPLAVTSFLPKLLPTTLVRAFSNNNNWAGDFPAVDGEPHSTQVISNKVSRSLWEPILKKAKSKGVSGHAILYALFILTWATLYDGFDIQVETPLNCRSMCNPPVPPNQMGNFVGCYSCHWKQDYLSQILDQKSFWEISKNYGKSLKENKVKGAKQTLFLKYLSDFPSSYLDYWKDKRDSPMKRSGGLELSDMGKFERQDSLWKLSSMYFCQSAQTFSVALGMNSVCLNGELHYTLCWQKGALDQEKIQKFNAEFNKLVHML